MSRHIPIAKVFRVELDTPLRALDVEERYDQALLVVSRRGRLVGTVTIPALTPIPVDVQRTAIVAVLGNALWRRELEHRFLSAVGAAHRTFPRPDVSVVVCTRERPDDLVRCLDAVAQLNPAPLEVIVVDSAPATDATRHVCEGRTVRYVVEPVVGAARARNRGIVESKGEVIAFTDDDCVPEPAWLSGLGAEFADPRVAAVTGLVLPLELETPAQWLFEAHGGLARGFERVSLDGAEVDPVTTVGRIGVSANVVVRRTALERVGLFAEWLGPGTPALAAEDYDLFCRLLAAGDRLVLDPGQVVWHRHRRELEALRRALVAYGHSSTAFATQRVLDGDLGAARVFRWWWLRHIPQEARRIATGAQNRLPVRLALAELLGTLTGPAGLWRSRRSRRGVVPLELAPQASALRAHGRLEVTAGDAPTVSVVVPTRDRAPALARLLRNLGTQTYPAERLEVVVVLDGSRDDSAQVARALDLPYRTVVRELEHVGVGAARNAGIAAATGELIVFLDDDVVPQSDCVERHTAAHRGVTPGVALGYAPPAVDGSWWSLALRAWWEDHFTRKADAARTLRWSDVVTLNSSFPRALLLEHGGFDEQFAIRHEDWELGVRLVAAGVPLRYVGDAVVGHELDCSFEGALARQRHEARADVLLTRCHPAVGRELPLAAVLFGGPKPPHPAGDTATAARLERQGRRGAWRRLTRALLREAYLAGVRDALPTPEAVRELADGVDAVPPVVLSVDLDGGPVPVVPPIGGVELALRVRGDQIARVSPARPGLPWDWGTALHQVEREASDEIRAAIVRLELSDPSVTRPEVVRAT